VTLRVGHNHFAVVSAGQNARAIARNGEDAALMHCDAALRAIRRNEQQRLLAKRERRGLPEKVRRDDRRARRDEPGTIDDGGDLGLGVGHFAPMSSLPEGEG
jgi:hypothetical protein